MYFSLSILMLLVNLQKFTQAACWRAGPSEVKIPIGHGQNLIHRLKGTKIGSTPNEILSYFEKYPVGPNFDIIEVYGFMYNCATKSSFDSLKSCAVIHCGYHKASGQYYVEGGCDSYGGECNRIKGNCVFDEDGNMLSCTG